MPKSQQAWGPYQHPATQWNLGIEGAADEAVLNKVHNKPKYLLNPVTKELTLSSYIK